MMLRAHNILLLVLVVLVAAWSVQTMRRHKDSPGDAYRRVYGEAAIRMGAELARANPAGGKVLVLTCPYASVDMVKVPKQQVKALATGWDDRPFKIVARVDGRHSQSPLLNAGIPDYMLEMAAALGGDASVYLEVDPQILLEQLEAHPDLAAVVSFCGFPSMPPGQWPTNAPPLVVFAPDDPMVTSEWLRSGHVLAAVCPKMRPRPETPERRLTPQEVFEVAFSVVTPQNLAEYEELEGIGAELD
jgi:hypothetical protein